MRIPSQNKNIKAKLNGENKNDLEAERERCLNQKFLEEKKEFARKLYNKSVTCMHSSIMRKSELNDLEKGILNRMHVNDAKISQNIDNLEKFRKGNGMLIISLERDNELTNEKMKNCSILENMKAKCEEMSNIYQSILSSYDEQAQSLDKIFEILKK